MFFWGILAVFQIVLLPGLLINRFYRIQGGFFFRLSSIMALSMIANFLTVYLLGLLGIYTRPVFGALIFIEVAALAWFYRKSITFSLDEVLARIGAAVNQHFKNLQHLFAGEGLSPAILFLRQLFQAVILGFALSLVIWFFRRLTNNIGTVFNTWDAVVAWNTWAQIWSTNFIPDQTGMYPQLLPANLSITYLLMANTEVVLFAKAIMPLFSLLIIFSLLELGIEQKKSGYFLAIIFSYLMFKKFTGDILTDGYADIPATFMAYLAFVQLFKVEHILEDKRALILGGVFAAGAALTKQVGVFVIVAYFIIAVLADTAVLKKHWKNLAFSISVAALASLVWYAPKLILIAKDFANSNLFALTDVAAHTYQDVSTAQRVLQAFLSLEKYLVLYLAALPLVFLLEKRFRWIVVVFILPFSILWSIIASYDPRNLAITFPVVAVVCGLGFEKFSDVFFRFVSKIKTGKISAWSLVILAILTLVGLGMYFNQGKIIAMQRERQRQIFSPEINEWVYTLPFGEQGCSRVLTNYPVMYLPGLETNQVNSYFSDYENHQLLISDPAVCWMLVPNYAEDAIKKEIEAKVASGEYTLLFETKEWVPYQLVKIR